MNINMYDIKTMGNNKPIFFLHIHKTAGTSFITLLDQQYTTADVCPSDWPFRQRIHEVSPSELLKAKFIRGHFSYEDLQKKIHATPRTITFLRDPVARFISHYLHLHHAPGDPDGVHEQIYNLSLEKFVLNPSLSSTIANMGVRLIGGTVNSNRSVNCIPNLKLVKERLEAFEFIGIQEEFSKSMELFTYQYNVPSIMYSRRDNVAFGTKEHSAVSEHTLSMIAEINQDDI